MTDFMPYYAELFYELYRCASCSYTKQQAPQWFELTNTERQVWIEFYRMVRESFE